MGLLGVNELLQVFGLHYRIRVKRVTCTFLAKEAKQGGQVSVSRVRLHKGTRWRGRRLPRVGPYCMRGLGPEPPVGACRRLFDALIGLLFCPCVVPGARVGLPANLGAKWAQTGQKRTFGGPRPFGRVKRALLGHFRPSPTPPEPS